MMPSLRGLPVLPVVVLFGAGCSFDTSATPFGGDGSVTSDHDGGIDATVDPDCAQDVVVQIRVNGATEPLGPDRAFAEVLVGDSVSLSAEGSCTRRGDIQYSWLIEPLTAGVGATASPDLAAESISVFAPQEEKYTVRLTVSDRGGAEDSVTIFAFEAHGFRKLDHLGGAGVSDLAVGTGGSLWIGASAGAYRADLAAPGAGPYANVSDLYDGEAVPNKISTVHEQDGRVWFGRETSGSDLWLLDLALASIDRLTLPESLICREIDGAVGGVRLASDKGTFVASDGVSFGLERAEPAAAIADGIAGAWSGGDRLYPLPVGAEFNVFGGNNKITALENLDAVLWVGGDNKGIASVVDGAVVELFTSANSGLGSDRVTDIAFDGTGDVWVATRSGVSRYKVDRQIWVAIDADSGLSGLSDLRTIAIDDLDGRRAIYAGGPAGLVIMSLP